MLVLNAEAKGLTIRGLETIVFGASPLPSELLWPERELTRHDSPALAAVQNINSN